MVSTSVSTTSARPVIGVQARLATGLAALGFGLLVFLATGFAAPSLIHNATHDTRHAFGLPCH